MSSDLAALRSKIEAWDLETEDLPDEVALAMDEHPELRDAFDARFEALPFPEEPAPDALLDRVRPAIPEPGGRWRVPELAAVSSVAVAVGVLLAVFVVGPSSLALPSWTTQPSPRSTDLSLLVESEGTPADPANLRTPSRSDVDDLVVKAAPDQPLFDPDLPPGPRRLPTRPQRYTHPPGGPLQYEAVLAARTRDCPSAMAAIREGMVQVSVDHATLYRGAWLCFNEAHQRKLEQDESPTWDHFVYVLEHFEGAHEDMEAAAEADPGLRDYPRWYRPPVGGIEHRLVQYTYDEQLVDVVHDLFGEATIADHLAKDVHLEALAALGLSRVRPEERTPALVDAWARRVYVTAWALTHRPGRSIGSHRQELLPVLRRLLDAATASPGGKDWPVPEVVLRARAVGEGNAPEPRGSR